MRRASLRAGGVYALAVFALGFLLGTIRVLVLIPRLGEARAVLLELPVMLTAAWFICRAVLHRWPVPATGPARLAMGGFAFALLMLLEALLALLLGTEPARWLAGLATPAGAPGLAGQLLFALFPLLQRAPPRP